MTVSKFKINFLSVITFTIHEKVKKNPVSAVASDFHKQTSSSRGKIISMDVLIKEISCLVRQALTKLTYLS